MITLAIASTPFGLIDGLIFLAINAGTIGLAIRGVILFTRRAD